MKSIDVETSSSSFESILLTLKTLRVISIKFLLVVSMLHKTEWSQEFRTGSHKMNLLDIFTISPQYF